MESRLLTVNAGSSSVKFALFAPGDPPRRLEDGKIERLSADSGDSPAKEHASSAQLSSWIDEHLAGASLAAIGHRVVHGGPKFTAPCASPATSSKN